jgi:hypothetical protein
MEITNDEIEVMMIWIMKKMKYDSYFPVKTLKAKEILKQIIREEIFPGIEFNEDYTKVRNVNMFLSFLF